LRYRYYEGMSEVDSFLQACAAIADPVLGEDTLVLDNGVSFKGIWSGVATTTQAEDGGPVLDVDASVCGTLGANITRQQLIGKVGTAKSERFRVINAEIGEAFTTLYLVHASQFAAR
jgi:hypothetical protein